MFRAVEFHHQEVSIMDQYYVQVHGSKCVQVVLNYDNNAFSCFEL